MTSSPSNDDDVVWVPDEDASNCVICFKEFSKTKWKHHCRVCGKIVCGECSINRIKIPNSNDKVRVCELCVKDKFSDEYNIKNKMNEDIRNYAKQQNEYLLKAKNILVELSDDIDSNNNNFYDLLIESAQKNLSILYNNIEEYKKKCILYEDNINELNMNISSKDNIINKLSNKISNIEIKNNELQIFGMECESLRILADERRDIIDEQTKIINILNQKIMYLESINIEKKDKNINQTTPVIIARGQSDSVNNSRCRCLRRICRYCTIM
eukprot:GHVL01027929.1.p1 GENE.GHVL01027929.1~~GHVL01027929.1.p1  ORF type:complete len:269 (+),score=96.14 GHVL01027929.1:100-906(+)